MTAETEQVQHTPGPWETSPEPDDYNSNAEWILIESKAHDRDIADLRLWDQQARADARLIAAAPLMLEALKTALDYLESECPHESTDDCTSCALICYDARAAIRAATGEDA